MGKIALVTGGNQGLGFALVQGLAERLGPEDIVYLTARSEDRGQAALASLKPGRAEVRFAPLDVTSPSSIGEFAALMTARHGGIDLVASNAAARMVQERPQSEQVRQLVVTNNHGSRDLYEALAPLLNRDARYIMVCSSFGQLRKLPEHLWGYFDIERHSLADIEASMDHYVDTVEAGRSEAEGWPDWINVASKIGQVATARIAAREMTRARGGDGILINAVCPGLVDTAASRPWFDDMSEAQTPDQAAMALVDLLLLPPGTAEPHGELMRFGKAVPWL